MLQSCQYADVLSRTLLLSPLVFAVVELSRPRVLWAVVSRVVRTATRALPGTAPRWNSDDFVVAQGALPVFADELNSWVGVMW